ncbi:hypothetical protein DL764_005962 [Monosporascus ibericus]|uniref:AAA+ ATPase domain-containing protein n=1 Tax=Monosporascus ibericus TaxID=155417 RepID=A0A4Q4TA88_9PEZI|nr:hypothetical protein DL764_005962 [Monosporascus ibericus]
MPTPPASAIKGHSPPVAIEQVKEMIQNIHGAVQSLKPLHRTFWEQFFEPDPIEQLENLIQDTYEAVESLKPLQPVTAFSSATVEQAKEMVQKPGATNPRQLPPTLVCDRFNLSEVPSSPCGPTPPNSSTDSPVKTPISEPENCLCLEYSEEGEPKAKFASGSETQKPVAFATTNADEPSQLPPSIRQPTQHTPASLGIPEQPVFATSYTIDGPADPKGHQPSVLPRSTVTKSEDKGFDSKGLDQPLAEMNETARDQEDQDNTDPPTPRLVEDATPSLAAQSDAAGSKGLDPPLNSIEGTRSSLDKGTIFAERLVSAVKQLIVAKAPTKPSATPEMAPTNKREPKAGRASRLEFKRVDEVWDERTYKYQIVESEPEVDDLDKYVFIVRDRVEKKTQDTTSYIDIKSPFLGDILVQACREIRSVSLASISPSTGTKYLHLETRYMNWDGKVLGESTTGIKIPIFRGAKRIDHLNAYPLQYHSERERVTRELIKCGRTFISLAGTHYRQYKGRAFFIGDEGEIVPLHVEGRTMVDVISFQEQNPRHPCPRVHRMKPTSSVTSSCDPTTPADVDPTQLEESDLLTSSPTVLGFCLSSKRFLEFAVANISEISWSPASFDDVKIPENQNEPIWALVDTYLKGGHNDTFNDLVSGKGHGINFLLYGPPGVGKTLTAETIAETSKAPLYTIASRWKAILLLDEADVFLARRSDNAHLNALVSVFLRELEQYNGILFLTTNRVQSFDEAMISRVHLAWKYEPLRREARKAVLQYFLAQAETKQGHPALQSDKIDDLSEKKLNGREAMAEDQNTVVKETHLDSAISAREQFYYEFHGAASVASLDHYN